MSLQLSWKHCIYLWDASNGSTSELVTVVDDKGPVTSVNWTPDSCHIAIGLNNSEVQLWDSTSNRQTEHELLSSHGFTQNQLKLWKYPSMVKMAELTGHASRVLFMAQSPGGCTVASAAGDETLRLWNVFGTPKAANPAQKFAPEPFSSMNHIR